VGISQVQLDAGVVVAAALLARRTGARAVRVATPLAAGGAAEELFEEFAELRTVHALGTPRRASELEAGVPVGRRAKALAAAVRRAAAQLVIGGALFGI